MTVSVNRLWAPLALSTATALASPLSQAGENLFGYVQGAETLPEGAKELYQKVTVRSDKGKGEYQAINYETEYEYGATNRFSVSAAFGMMSIDTSGLIIDGYLPMEEQYGLRPASVEVAGKYMFLSPALDDIGLSARFSGEYSWIDPHSGQDKNTYSLSSDLLLQKFAMEGRLIWVGNLGFESTYADREEIDNLPAGFDWPTDPEMELEYTMGAGVSYRFARGWFASLEAQYQTEFETEVGQERWSVFAGPSLHYSSAGWWANLTWFPQLEGGGETYPEQSDTSVHLVEKTEQEWRLKIGFNF